MHSNYMKGLDGGVSGPLIPGKEKYVLFPTFENNDDSIYWTNDEAARSSFQSGVTDIRWEYYLKGWIADGMYPLPYTVKHPFFFS